MRKFLEVLRHPKAQLQAMAKNAQSNRAQGEEHFEAGDFGAAEKSFQLAAEESGGGVARRIEVRLHLADAQRKLVKLDDAEANYRKALALATAEQDVGLQVLCLHTLGEILIEQAKFPEAQKTLEETIRIDGQRKTADPLLMARRVRQLGIVFHQMGRREDSSAKLAEAAALYEKTRGEMHAETGTVLAELGVAYRAQEKYKESEKCFTRALNIHEKCCGRQSAEALRDLSELAQTLAESGELKRAIAEYERAVTLQESVIGGTFQQMAEMQLTLAGLYVDAGNFGRAQELLTHAVGGLRSTGGSRLAIAHEALAHVHEHSGRLENALPQLEKAAAVWASCGRTEELAANKEHQAELAARMPKEEEPGGPVMRGHGSGIR